MQKKDKIFIENLQKSNKQCRNCKHRKIWHPKNKCIDLTIINKYEFKCCKCKEFIPGDNLDYIEYLVKKRKLLK
jgi:hypothetical protein